MSKTSQYPYHHNVPKTSHYVKISHKTLMWLTSHTPTYALHTIIFKNHLIFKNCVLKPFDTSYYPISRYNLNTFNGNQ